MLRAMKFLWARGLCLCRAWATSSLPVPLWPLISTEMLERESRPMARNTSCMAGASPMISGLLPGSCWRALRLVRCSFRWFSARRTRVTASSMSNGLGRYSKAPRW
ncbi:hypothetical protein D3C79_740170 [compost metagenome]